MSAIHLGDLPTWLAAGGTIAAVVVALVVARGGTRQAAEERRIAADNLQAERDRVERQRQIDRDTSRLLEIYDLYAKWRTADGGQQELFSLHPRLAALPPEIAVTIRLVLGTTPDANGRDKLAALSRDYGEEITKDNVGSAVIKLEAEFDLWWLSQINPPGLETQPWNTFQHRAAL